MGILADMENEPASTPTPDEASLALTGAVDARRRLTDSLVLPSFFFSSIGLVIAAQICTSAVGLARQDLSGWLLIVAGWAALALVAGVQLWRFRRLNGVWVSGLAHRVVLGTAETAAVAYGLGFAGAIWAALEGAGWLVAGSSLAGGVAYAWSGRHWWGAYRGDPGTYARPVSRALLASGGAVAAIGAVVLLVTG